MGTSLARDLQTISALAGDFSASFDPAVKLNFQNSSSKPTCSNKSSPLSSKVNQLQLKISLKPSSV
jgi:hypothetical protein